MTPAPLSEEALRLLARIAALQACSVRVPYAAIAAGLGAGQHSNLSALLADLVDAGALTYSALGWRIV